MPKDRTVDRFFWDDPQVGMRLSREERLLMIGCWTKLADDEGRFLADAGYVRKEIFGYDTISIEEVFRMLQKISEVFRSWVLYEIGEHRYIQIDSAIWKKHQEIRWVCKSKIPPLHLNGNNGTSEDFGKLPKISENCGTRDARAVGLGSVGLGSENQCASDNAPIFDLAPECVQPPRNWKRKLFDEEFWPNSWRKVAKTAAWNSFEAKAKDPGLGEKIVAAMLAQKPAYERRESDKRPYMSTWLNQERFSDDGPEVSEPPANRNAGGDYPEMDWKKGIE